MAMNKDVIFYSSCRDDDPVRGGHRRQQKLDKGMQLLDKLDAPHKEVCIDEGFDGPLSENPQLQRIIRRIHAREVGTFVVDSIFSLGDDLQDSLEFLKYLLELDVRVICIDNNIDSAMAEPDAVASEL